MKRAEWSGPERFSIGFLARRSVADGWQRKMSGEKMSPNHFRTNESIALYAVFIYYQLRVGGGCVISKPNDSRAVNVVMPY